MPTTAAAAAAEPAFADASTDVRALAYVLAHIHPALLDAEQGEGEPDDEYLARCIAAADIADDLILEHRHADPCGSYGGDEPPTGPRVTVAVTGPTPATVTRLNTTTPYPLGKAS